MSEPKIAAWLVDLDGTLYHPLPVKICAGLDLALGSLLGGPRAWRVVRTFRAEHERLRAESSSGAAEASPYQLQLANTAGRLGLPEALVGELVRRWMEERPGRWLRLFRRRALLREIAEFRAAGGRTALVSDYPARLKLQALGVQELFEVVVASGEPGGPSQLKPAPAGYLAAAASLGLGPERCLVLGDREDADGAAARSAGMAYRKIG